MDYGGDGVIITTENESCISEVKGDLVVCTVSLGVIQARTIEFLPPFPQWKVDAFNEIKMGAFCKVFAKFSSTFWDHKGIKYNFIAHEKYGYYPIWKNVKNAKGGNTNIMWCMLTGEEATRVE